METGGSAKRLLPGKVTDRQRKEGVTFEKAEEFKYL